MRLTLFATLLLVAGVITFSFVRVNAIEGPALESSIMLNMDE